MLYKFLNIRSPITSCNYIFHNNLSGKKDFTRIVILGTYIHYILLGTPLSAKVRLTGGDTVAEGRIEVLLSSNEAWGTICDDHFDYADAQVICRMLGYAGTLRVQSFGAGSGPIWFDDVACEGDESSILECGHAGLGDSNCGHAEDIGVVCLGT